MSFSSYLKITLPSPPCKHLPPSPSQGRGKTTPSPSGRGRGGEEKSPALLRSFDFFFFPMLRAEHVKIMNMQQPLHKPVVFPLVTRLYWRTSKAGFNFIHLAFKRPYLGNIYSKIGPFHFIIFKE